MAALHLKVEWRFAMLEFGAQCVTAAGMTGMLLSSVCNWDFKEQVYGCNAYNCMNQ